MAGSGGAVLGYLWLRPSEEDREIGIALRSAKTVKLLLGAFLTLSVVSQVYFWRTIEGGTPIKQLIAVAGASFFTLGFYGVVTSGVSFLRTQRLVWTMVGREQMHEVVRQYRQRELKLEEPAQDFEELLNYTNMFFEA